MMEQAAMNHWIDGAKRMLQAARHATDSGDYEVALFTCHLAVEKMLKAKLIALLHRDPPMTHDLVDLCTEGNISLTEDDHDQLKELTTYSAFSRYGDESWVESEATEENCRHWLEISSLFLKRFRP